MMIELLFNEGCSFPSNSKSGRELPNSNAIKLNVQKELFSRLATALLSCQGRQTIQTTTPRTSIATTQTTTPIPPPTECQSAINLTEYWRKDYYGNNIRPINGNANCDARDMVASGKPWFRFTEAAGIRLFNQCIPSLNNNAGSCGTHIAMWSNDSMPQQVGVISSIQFYGSWSGNCRYWTKQGDAMKCSDKPYDYVYRYRSSYTGCYVGFCGMD